MAKGNPLSSGKKTTHYNFKKRCCISICKKRARHIVNDKPYCRIHWREV
jgi:hypothetical protein